MRQPLVLRLLATPRAVPEVRRALRAYLGGPCDEVQLCASELITNVVRHVGDGVPVTVRLFRVAGGRTRLEVTDPDPRALPVLCRAADSDEAGRGLALLDGLTLRWGVEQGPGAKTVWCELLPGYAGAAYGPAGEPGRVRGEGRDTGRPGCADLARGDLNAPLSDDFQPLGAVRGKGDPRPGRGRR